MTNEIKKCVFINGNRTGYHPDQIYRTATIEELIAHLEELGDYIGMDAPVYLRNDNGYTYGGISLNWEGDVYEGAFDEHRVYIDPEELEELDRAEW